MAAIDAPAGQIHHRGRAVNELNPITRRFTVPMGLTEGAALIRFRASEHDHFVIFRNQKWRKRLSDETAPPGQNDAWFHIAAFP
jgi:hypothetical protein